MNDTLWGGEVILYGGKRYYVQKVNPKNLRIEDSAGKTFNLPRTAPWTKDENQKWEGVAPKNTATDRFEELMQFHLGDTVTISEDKYPGVYVVGGINGSTLRLVKLNGGTNAYVRATPNLVTKVDL